MQLSGSRVVVTGASRGIGAGARGRVAKRGARVALVARSRDAIAELAADLGGDAYPADLADAAAIEPLVARIEADGPDRRARQQRRASTSPAPSPSSPADRIRELHRASTSLAPMLLSRAVIPGMRERGPRPHHERVVARGHQRAARRSRRTPRRRPA